jgi:hypothetical protein
MAGQRLWKYAEACARRDGLCFVHERSAGPPVFAVMTTKRSRELTGREFNDEDTPVHGSGWDCDHATPEMVGFVAECEVY